MTEQNHEWWEYDQLPSGEPYDWGGAARGDKEWDALDFHLDLGCGTIKKGRLGIDRFYAPGVDLLIDLSRMLPSTEPFEEDAEQAGKQTMLRYNASLLERYGSEEACEKAWETFGPSASSFLPFPSDSIESIISHHFFEHLTGDRAIALVDECHRVLKPGGLLRIIVPLFPSISAVGDLDHKSFWTPQSIEAFTGTPDGHSWMESFSVPYAKSRFEKADVDISPPTPFELMWTDQEAREMRVALRKWA